MLFVISLSWCWIVYLSMAFNQQHKWQIDEHKTHAHTHMPLIWMDRCRNMPPRINYSKMSSRWNKPGENIPDPLKNVLSSKLPGLCPDPLWRREIFTTSIRAQLGTEGKWESRQAKISLGPLEKRSSLWFLTPGASWGHGGKEQLRKRNSETSFIWKEKNKKHGFRLLKIKH